MSVPANPWRSEVERIKRVSDMLISSHAALFDRYTRLALVLDLSIFLLSAWLVSLAFANEETVALITPRNIKPLIWLGLLGLFSFTLSIVQLLVNWKSKADAHKRSQDFYADVKREAVLLLAATDPVGESAAKALAFRYGLGSLVGTAIPEREFLRQKRRHNSKVRISRVLDSKPSASLLLLSIKFWLGDNVGRPREND